ncbi:hypothetical protein EDC04DRAFT_2689028 [Pisolithus marmoratus]|nr:hypothetical protein EDC04DRAFT_2689028 [Pisolithus marmoratus]
MQCPRHDYGFVAAPHAAGAKYLALRQPKGISLPANEHLVLLLKALSSRLVGKYLVMTTIQCSDFYEIKMYGARTDSGDDSASKRVSYSTEPEVLTPLCIIASPQVWRRELPCVQRREQFKNIRYSNGIPLCGATNALFWANRAGSISTP